ncbi:unnamed protein product [Albugo candida]|uniref:Uncharacterized protein n=1 Tax=Albugo candida TaxID=65357 RepID=A0A024GA74_9STRA|nr:unnamed protein product [Albugo candida]|eukprot:CCI43673.1 unnamed protein product [Albugo candida]
MTFQKGLSVCFFTSITTRTAVLKDAKGESENVAHYWTLLLYEKYGIARTVFIQSTRVFCCNHRDSFHMFGHASHISSFLVRHVNNWYNFQCK